MWGREVPNSVLGVLYAQFSNVPRGVGIQLYFVRGEKLLTHLLTGAWGCSGSV